MTRHGPDATTAVSVYLTTAEIGKAFANRSDDEQVEILKAIVAGFDSPSTATMQATYIGGRLLDSAGDSATRDAIDFLRTILDALASKASDVASRATPKE